MSREANIGVLPPFGYRGEPGKAPRRSGASALERALASTAQGNAVQGRPGSRPLKRAPKEPPSDDGGSCALEEERSADGGDLAAWAGAHPGRSAEGVERELGDRRAFAEDEDAHLVEGER